MVTPPVKNQRSWLLRPQTLGLSAGLLSSPPPDVLRVISGITGILKSPSCCGCLPSPSLPAHFLFLLTPFPVLGAEPPCRSGSWAGTPLPPFWRGCTLLSCPHVLSQSSALCCTYSAGPSGRRRVLSVCLPLPLPSPHPTARASCRVEREHSSTVHAGPGAPNATEPHWLAPVFSPVYCTTLCLGLVIQRAQNGRKRN